MTDNILTIPEWAEGALIAELRMDESDSMTDLFISRSERKMLLGFSKHGRNNFKEMRKFAARFERTQHLGPGKGEFKIWDTWEGQNGCPVSHIFTGDDCIQTWQTLEEAQAYVDRHQGYDDHMSALLMSGEIEAFCPKISGELTITGSVKEIEKRRQGYYLGTAHHSGWQVHKWGLGGQYYRDRVLEMLKDGSHCLDIEPSPAPIDPVDGVAFRQNSKFGGIEIVFQDKPSTSVRDALKNNGFRWHRKKELWYAKETPERLAFAQSLSSDFQAA